ncbi:hypothetical protein AYL99_00243 [Fonsecaea erecta]|uniref:Uncharacterized protein n=1 Tax=Fonsecaea erecta TaxID=1367422 RepID=A0A178ZY70_9EURO|nr:hypothetical protein AYL99_00243 [Fonsecaea erecta]OAP64271.1 hypothetical protein AYL99_00243 [Fonsecaea erecta]
MAIAGLHAKSRNLPSLDREISRLRLRALKKSHQISRRTWRPAVPEQNSASDEITNAGFYFRVTNVESDDLCLVTTAALMAVFGKLSGEVYEDIRPYLEFAQDYLRRQGISQDNGGLFKTPLHLFLYNLVSYNQLLALVADTSVTSKSCGGYEEFILRNSSHQKRPNFAVLLCRISNIVQHVSSFDIDCWDVSLDFLPSCSMRRKAAEHAGAADVFLTQKPSSVTTGAGSNAKRDEKIIIGEIYRISSRIHFFKQLRDRDGLIDTPTTLAYPPFIAHKQIKKYSKRAIDLFRSLSKDSQFNTAILLPLGIIAPELTSERDQTFVIERLNILERTQCFGVFRIFSQDLQHRWSRIHDSRSNSLPPSLFKRPVRLLG